MTAFEPFLTLTRDPRLAPYATGAAAAWLWSEDGTRILWANAAGAAVLGAADPHALTGQSFAGQPLAEEVRQIAASLPLGGAKLSRLTCTGASEIACTCARIALAGGNAIRIVATEAAQPPLPLVARVARLFAPGETPLAVFSGMGALLHASPQMTLGSASTLAALGAGALMAQAIAAGRAQGPSAIGEIMIERLGSAGATVLLAMPGTIAAIEVPPEEPAGPPVAASLQEIGAALRAAVAPAPPEPSSQPEPEPSPTPAEARATFTVVPAVQNVVPFRAPEKRPALSAVETSAFREIAETLAAPEELPPVADQVAEQTPPAEPAPAAEQAEQTEPDTDPSAMPSAFATGIEPDAAHKAAEADARAILERLPVGILIHRADALIYANRAFLEWTGYADLASVADAGGLERLVVEPGEPLDRLNGTGKTFQIATRTGGTIVCEGRLFTVPWESETALMLVLSRTAADDRLQTAELTAREAAADAREMRAILDTATDGVILTDREGRVLALNRSAEALFGYAYHEIARRPFTELFAAESERIAREYLDGLTRSTAASVLNDGREVIGRVRQGGLIPLFMTMGRIGEGEKLCAVFRDITQWKRAEEDLTNARRTAERASSQKSDFLAKISHEIRTPLNAIIGFSEVMMEERFGPIGNERYREYLKDIHASGGHLVSLINDLLDLSKIEAGKLDLVFASVNLNSLVQQCVALMQPQANRERIIIRSSLFASLPPVMADARSVRQIVLNLLSNSIKFTGPGGQVIVSTAQSERGDITLRVRDTGVGMTDKEIETAMEPFRQLATSTRYGSGGTGLGLPLTKALAEANRARFAIESARDAGTLVEITFPAVRVAAE